MSCAAPAIHGDPIAPVILGVTSIGMLPRGGVGLVVAATGRTLGVIGDEIFAAIVAMVFVTTLAAPPLLKHAINRQLQRQAAA